MYQNQLKQGVTVTRHYADLPTILGYPDELIQVWTNLIHNALQAMNHQGQLKIWAYRSDDAPNDAPDHGDPIPPVPLPMNPNPSPHAIISITDNGCGIAPDVLPRIFAPFFTTKAAGEGSGLGLDIVQKIIDKHGGQITVTSQPGQTTFKVWLPLDRQA